ncbi:MAG: type II secretion system F family protein, partial [Frankia sp.]
VGALILAAGSARGAGLRKALGMLAEATEARVRGAREIEADRAKPRAGARTVLLIIAVCMGAVLLAGRHFLSPYRSPTGQLVLAVDGVLFTAALLWMRALGRAPALPRLLPKTDEPVAAARVGRPTPPPPPPRPARPPPPPPGESG